MYDNSLPMPLLAFDGDRSVLFQKQFKQFKQPSTTAAANRSTKSPAPLAPLATCDNEAIHVEHEIRMC
jgi:hypothetical protein